MIDVLGNLMAMEIIASAYIDRGDYDSAYSMQDRQFDLMLDAVGVEVLPPPKNDN